MASKRINKVASIAEKKCTNSGYGNTFLDGLSKMRVGQKLCDFSLDVQGEIIYVHKVALALASDYFASMFDIDMEEKRKGVIKLKDVDIITIHTLVEYIYSGVITLTKENVENLLSIADLFQILWVKEQCAEFLKLSVNRKNCFRIRKFAVNSAPFESHPPTEYITPFKDIAELSYLDCAIFERVTSWFLETSSLFWIGSDYARFDIQMNKWEEMAPPKYTYKDRFTAVIAADNIYLLDGRVERYSVLENEWTTVNAEQFVYLGGAGAALTGPFDFN
ncbi:hypothetical protein GQX74_011765 [Glossina fuscipes]|nr:hypothetical protein GQX74_011765 [Glossina fuscipes]